MASSPPSRPAGRLTALQQDLLEAFFQREQRFFLTGGGALAGFYFGHRTTEDLDFFSAPGPDLAEVARTTEEAARACGATIEARSSHADFRRIVARRGAEDCVIDLVIDRAPMIESQKLSFGSIRVDTTREILANKICALIGRSEIKDLVDLETLLGAGGDLDRGFVDARRKDASADPATLSWVLENIKIQPHALLPGGVDPAKLEAFRADFVTRLRKLAFEGL